MVAEGTAAVRLFARLVLKVAGFSTALSAGDLECALEWTVTLSLLELPIFDLGSITRSGTTKKKEESF